MKNCIWSDIGNFFFIVKRTSHVIGNAQEICAREPGLLICFTCPFTLPSTYHFLFQLSPKQPSKATAKGELHSPSLFLPHKTTIEGLEKKCWTGFGQSVHYDQIIIKQNSFHVMVEKHNGTRPDEQSGNGTNAQGKFMDPSHCKVFKNPTVSLLLGIVLLKQILSESGQKWPLKV